MTARLLSALMGLMAILFVNTASAASFNAKVHGHVTRPQGACPDGATLCGTTSLDGYGRAQYRWFEISRGDPSDVCGPLAGFRDYGAIVTFTLSDGSVLVLQEFGTQCTPGKSLHKGGPKSYGNPRFFVARWEVLAGLGQFSNLTGHGTNVGTFAGAAIVSRYGGVLTELSGIAGGRVSWDIIVNDAPGTCEEVGASLLVVNLSGPSSTKVEFDCSQKSAEFAVDAGDYTIEINLEDSAGNALNAVPIVLTQRFLPDQTIDLGTFLFSFVL